MTNDEEAEAARNMALSRALRGNVDGRIVPRDPNTLPPTRSPEPILGPRGAMGGAMFAAEDKSKRRKQIDDAEDAALS